MIENPWELTYKKGMHINSWPWSDLVSLVNKYAKSDQNSKIKILELGCGTGNNIPFLSSLGQYWGVDFSGTAVEFTKIYSSR